MCKVRGTEISLGNRNRIARYKCVRGLEQEGQTGLGGE
jgi:hypothetical protein